MGKRWIGVCGFGVALGLALITALSAEAELPPGGTFVDDDGGVHEGAIEALVTAGATQGCDLEGPRFCPARPMPRGQAAAFLVRALDLPPSSIDFFGDDNGHPHEASINSLRAAGVTNGCGLRTFCPDRILSRAQMASLLVRAFDLPPALQDWFTDDTGSVHEDAINRLRQAGVTQGCAASTLFCPMNPTSRAQMASFLVRALGLTPTAPPPRGSTPTTTPPNLAPTANSQSVGATEDGPGVPIVLTGSDPEGLALTFTVTIPPTGGVLGGTAPNLTYTPHANFSGTDTFQFRVSDGLNLSEPATVTITIPNVDDLPLAVDDSATVLEDSGATAVGVLGNDTDVDGGPTTIGSVTQPANGAVAITGGGTGLTYASNEGYCNTPPGTTPDTFTYTLNGGSVATVNVTVTCVDDPPVAVNDSATVGEDSGASAVAVLANDTDVDGGPTTIGSVTQPADGTVVVTGGGTGLTYAPNSNYCNTAPATNRDTFTYTLNGGSTATVSMTVTCVDDVALAVDDAGTVAEDSGSNAVVVLANDTDVDGGATTIDSVTQPANGTAAITGGGTGVSYAPNADYCNNPPGTTPDEFTYTLNGGSVATVSMAVTCVDDPPVAVDDSATVAEDSGATAVAVLANDTDLDGGPKAIQSTSDPANGTVAITGGGTGLTYAPDADYCNNPPGSTLDTFTYALTPGGSTATVSMTVTCVDDGPTGVNDSATVVEDSGATAVAVLANDTDLDGGPKTVTLASDPANGTVVITGGGTGLTYEPDADYCNTPPGTTPDTFTYMLNGGSTATVSMTVTCVDDDPVAADDSATVIEDATATAVAVLANDTDVDGGTNLVTLASDPTNGTVVITGGGTGVTYAPDANYCNTPPGTAPDTFTYTTTGGSTATVSMTVTCVDDDPVAVNDAVTVAQDAAATAVEVLANDTDIDGGPKLITLASDPVNGTVVITGSGTGLTYAPDTGYCNDDGPPAPDTFTYTITGGSTATVSMTVTCPNAAPDAIDDAATRTEDSGAVAIAVLANDTDAENDPITIQSVTDPANGTVVITGGGTGLTYAPDANYCNSPPGTALDTFTYTINRGDTATVTVTVTCVDDNPIAATDAATVVEDSGATAVAVLDNDTDVDGGPKAITLVSDPDNGTVVITGGGTGLTYAPDANYCNTPPGTTLDTFTYTITGGSVATVTVTVTCVDDLPVAVNDSATVTEDATATAAAVLDNDTDVDGGPKAITLVSDPDNGTVVITGGGTGLTYAPDANYCNTPPGTTLDTFTYTITGGSVATVTVTVTCVDDLPVAVNDSATVTEDATATAVPVLTNDTDVDGGPKAITLVSDPANGTVVITGGGTGLTYAPDANYCNAPPGTTLDTFTYTITGGSVATVTVTVTCVNDAPTAAPKAYDAQANMPITIPAPSGLLVGATDVEAGSTFTLGTVGTTTPAGGTITTNADGSFTFNPPSGVTGSVTFPYQVCDNGFPAPGVCSANATVTFTVTGPVIWFVDDGASGTETGRMDQPFNTVPEAVAAIGANTGHRVFLFDGTYPTGIALKAGGWLIGQPVTGTSFDTVMGITPPTGTATRPSIATAGPATVGGTVTLNTNAVVRGIALNTGTDTALNDIAGAITGVTVNETSVTTTTGVAIDLDQTAGTLQFGAITHSGPTGAGIDLTNNAGATITFTGAITINSGSSPAFTATGGGPAATTGGTVAATAATSTLTTTTGTALNVTNTTIGGAGLNFRSISSNGAAQGIVLNNTGSSGGLSVLGNGGTCTTVATCTGGTIQSATVGVSLTNTTSVAIDRMLVQNTTQTGVKGTLVTNFSFTNGMVSSSGTARTVVDSSNIGFNTTGTGTEVNLTGVVTITGNTLTDAWYQGIDIFNYGGTISNANISNNNITSSTSFTDSVGGGIRFVAFGGPSAAGSITRATIDNNSINNFPSGVALQVQCGNANSAAAPASTCGTPGNATNVVNITNNKINAPGGGSSVKTGAEGVIALVNGVGQGNFNISNNDVRDNAGTSISSSAFGNAIVTETISGNTVVSNNTVGSQGIGIGTSETGGFATNSPSLTASISNNNVSQTDGNGILAVARDSSAGQLRVKVLNNTVAGPLGGVRQGIRIDAGNSRGDNDVCLQISGNASAPTVGQPAALGIGLRKQGTSTTVNAFGIVGLSPSPAATPAVESFVNAANPAGGGTLLISGTSGFTSCPAF